jgi:hypothetical protein
VRGVISEGMIYRGVMPFDDRMDVGRVRGSDFAGPGLWIRTRPVQGGRKGTELVSVCPSEIAVLKLGLPLPPSRY